MPRPKLATLATAKRFCRSVGWTLIHRDGEYIVKPQGEREDHPHTYFTNDLADAIATALAMTRSAVQSK